MFCKKILLLVCVCLFLFPLPVYADGVPSVSARNACLMNGETGEILFAVRENERRGMASTTKIMTAIVAIESLPPETPIRVSPKACQIEGSSVYLLPDEQTTLETLLYALMLQSANDAAVAIAHAAAGSVSAFTGRMNEKAKELGLTDTHFDNPHGLDSETHYTTAKELAEITRYALKNPLFRQIVGTKKKEIFLHDGKEARLLINHNRLVREYDDVIGVKTGFTKKCGRTLVSAAEQNGICLIAVTLNDGNDWRDHREMLDYGFSLYHEKTLLEAGEFSMQIPVCGGVKSHVTVKNIRGFSYWQKGNGHAIRTVSEVPHFLYADVRKNSWVGRLCFYENDRYLGSVPLICQEDIPYREKEKSNIFKWLFRMGKGR